MHYNKDGSSGMPAKFKTFSTSPQKILQHQAHIQNHLIVIFLLCDVSAPRPGLRIKFVSEGIWRGHKNNLS